MSADASLLGLGITLLMCMLLLVLPRQYALVPIIISICFLPTTERLVVAGLDFTLLRIIILMGWVRAIARGELRLEKLNAIDIALVAFVISGIATYTFLWGTSDAFVNRLGQAYNLIGGYFLFRFLVRGMDDVIRAFKVLAVCVIPLACSMLIEKISGRNMFAIFGGVPLITAIRNGSVRCQGPFAHPILAGTFAATIVPFFVALWCQEGNVKLLSVLAIMSGVIIVIASSSSGPVLAFLASCTAFALWPLRGRMRVIRWGILFALIGLEIVMKAHVWFLIARIDIVSGSTAYHRAYLIDRFIANFNDWWLFGIKSTGVWADTSIGLHDRTNQFIVYAADGGLVTLVLGMLVIAYCFRAVGLAWRAMGKQFRQRQLCIWALGASLFSHVVSFISVSYFDQNVVNWYLLLAMISTAYMSVHSAHEKATVKKTHYSAACASPR